MLRSSHVFLKALPGRRESRASLFREAYASPHTSPTGVPILGRPDRALSNLPSNWKCHVPFLRMSIRFEPALLLAQHIGCGRHLLLFNTVEMGPERGLFHLQSDSESSRPRRFGVVGEVSRRAYAFGDEVVTLLLCLGFLPNSSPIGCRLTADGRHPGYHLNCSQPEDIVPMTRHNLAR